jgi:hypothetical protein
MRWRLWLAIAAAAAIGLVLSLPAQPQTPSASSVEWPPAARGAIHVHSRRSEGSGTVDEIAAAASRAGLDFVILTDHGDGVREPEPPAYRSGVLCIDAVEVGTDGGHVIALGLPAAPYPLGGSPRDVVEDVARLGGFSIAAHPDSAKPELRWDEWEAPVDGIEWLNGDSEWRDEGVLTLTRMLVAFPFAGARALGLALDRPETTLKQWDGLLPARRVVAVAGADAHARLGLAEADTTSSSAALPVPSYVSVLGTFSVTVSPVSLTKNAETDARAVVDAIRAGHVYSTVDVVASPGRLKFQTTAGSQPATLGDVIDAATPIPLEVETNAPAGGQITLFRDGAPVAMSSETQLRFEAPAMPAAYRVEVNVPGSPGSPPVPWIMSNPIYIGARAAAAGQATPPKAAGTPTIRYPGATLPEWTVETSERSKADVTEMLTVRGRQIAWRWALGGVASDSPFAALVLQAGDALRANDRLVLAARASKPMRLSVQLRVPGAGAGERWKQSVYLEADAREIVIPFDQMTPVGTAAPHPTLADVRDVLLVADMVNTSLGTSGQVWIERLAYGR